MPRTTLNLDPAVLREVKRRAKNQGKSIGDVISEIVSPALAGTKPTRGHPKLHWLTGPMGPAKVDLEDKEAIRQAVDDQ